MTVEFDRAEDLPSLDVFWEDPTDEAAGGELYVLQQTRDDDQARTIVENAALAIQAASDSLLSQIENQDATLAHPLVHGFCWQALRDLRTSLFLAMVGRYRHAMVIQRIASEVAGLGVYFEENDDPDGWQASYEGSKSDVTPALGDIKDSLKALDPAPPREAIEALGKRYGVFSNIAHTVREGDIDEVMFSDEETAPIAPWAAYFDTNQLENWYEDFLEDMYLISYILHYYWGDVGDTETSGHVILGLYEQVAEGRVEHWEDDVSFDL